MRISDWSSDVCSSDLTASVLAGPGLGRDEEAWLRLECVMNSGLPLVLDADALVLLAQRGTERLKTLPHRPILTPHEGEFTRLFGSLDGSKLERPRQAASAINSLEIERPSCRERGVQNVYN